MNDETEHTVAYDLKSVKMPYLSGFALRLFTELLESPLRGLLLPKLLRDGGIAWLREQHFEEAPTFQPLHYTREPAQMEAWVLEAELPGPPTVSQSGFHFPTVHDYARAYREGVITPLEVAERAWRAIEASNAADPPLRAVVAVNREDVLRQAEAATQRIKRGESLGVFDGVPVAIKDEVDMVPYPTTVGTAFLGTSPALEDSTVVARMRAVGALLIGKANMHEIGIGVTGQNPHHGTPRNPYDPAHYTGGSSSGPAAAVAAGLCPVAIGADGGGSIRIPSAFCGVVGLKATFGRVSECGAAPLTWSMAHIGPLAATATDAALAYGIIAGPDPRDPVSLHQPAPTLVGWDNPDLTGLTLGVYTPWFHHATDDMVSTCDALLHAFMSMGATVREVTIPDLEAARVAHVITIVSEMAQAMARYHDDHHREHSMEVRINLALARSFTSRDYIQAQRARTRMMAHFARALQDVDAIITPMTGLPAPRIPPTAFPDGDSDLTTLTEIMRFATPANLTGLPAISFPAGYTAVGLPVGMQAIGRPWQEATLLRLALAAEHAVERRAPRVFYDLLKG